MDPMFGRAKKTFFFVLGFLSLVTGIIGIFVPLLPTTVFILIAAWCFMRSSERFHDWLMNHRRFGPVIRAWRETGAVPRRAKWLATLMIAVSVSILWFSVEKNAVRIGVPVFLGGVLIYLWTRPDAVFPRRPRSSELNPR